MFSINEYERRHFAVQKQMIERDIDCLIIPINESLTYLTGVRTLGYGAYLLVPSSGESTLICSPVSYWDVKEQGPLEEIYAGGETMQTLRETSFVKDLRGALPQDFIPEIVKWCKQRNYGNGAIGIVGREFDFPRGGGGLVGITGPAGLNHFFYGQLAEAFNGTHLVEATDILVNVRSIKSLEEINSHRQAALVADLCKGNIAEALSTPNVKDTDLFAAYWDTIFKNGGCGSWWFMIGCTKTANPQIRNFRDEPKDYAIQEGDCVIAEIMPASGDGYTGHSEATFLIGDCQHRDAYEKVSAVAIESFNTMAENLKPGIKGSEIAAIADEPIKNVGYQRGAPSAYGLGIFGLEPPFIGATGPGEGESEIKEGMVLCMISHVFDPETNISVRAGSTQLITEDGSEPLNKNSISGLTYISR